MKQEFLLGKIKLSGGELIVPKRLKLVGTKHRVTDDLSQKWYLSPIYHNA